MSASRLVCVVLLLVACKRSSTPNAKPAEATPAPAVAKEPAPPAPAGTGSAANVAQTPASDPEPTPQMTALAETLEDLLSQPECHMRSRETCARFMEIQKKVIAVGRNVPAGVDPVAWQNVYDDLTGNLEGLGPYCADEPPDDSVELPALYANYKRLLPLLAKTPGKAGAAQPDAKVSATPAPTGTGSAETPAGDPRPTSEMAALAKALDELLRKPESEARSRETCARFMEIKRKAIAVSRNVPAGVDPAAWETVNDDIRGSLEGLGPYCADEPPDDSVELPGLYANYKRLLPLLPKAP